MLYDVGIHMLLRNWNRMFYDVGSRMLLRSWKSYVVRCEKSYVVAKLKIVCFMMWDVAGCYKVGNRMLYDVGSCMLLRNWKSYVVRCGKSYVVRCGKSYDVAILEIIFCMMLEVVC